MSTANRRTPSKLSRGCEFIRANGGIGSVVKLVWRKLHERGLLYTLRAVHTNLSPLPRNPQRNYRHFITRHEAHHITTLLQQTTHHAPPSLLLISFTATPSHPDKTDASNPLAPLLLTTHVNLKATPTLPSNWQLITLPSPPDAVAINKLLAGSTADYFTILPPDALLSPLAPTIINNSLATPDGTPPPLLLYTDEDRFTPANKRHAPHFKPDWSPDTILDWPYSGHLTIFNLPQAHQKGLFTPTLTTLNAMVYDLTLKLALTTMLTHSTVASTTIRHIPAVLCHLAPSASLTPQALAEINHVRLTAATTINITATPEPASTTPPQCPKADLGFANVLALPHLRPLHHDSPLVTIIIPTRDHLDDLRKCLDSITNLTSYHHLEVVVIDNGSTHPATIAYFEQITPHISTLDNRKIPVHLLQLDIPFNFSTLNNRAASLARGDYLLFLNNDTEVITPDWVERLLGHAAKPWAGAVGATLLYPNTTIQHTGVATVGIGPTHVFNHLPHAYPHPRCQRDGNWSAVTAACLMVKSEKFHAIGGFNENLAVAFNDVDLCYRLHARGWFSILASQVRLFHHEFKTRGHDRASIARRQRMENELETLFTTWPAMRDDPFYHPALTKSYPNFLPLS